MALLLKACGTPMQCYPSTVFRSGITTRANNADSLTVTAFDPKCRDKAEIVLIREIHKWKGKQPSCVLTTYAE